MSQEFLNEIRRSWNGLGTTGNFKFHERRGQNIRILKKGTSARRVSGFSHGVCFSQCPLLPGQIFLIEITDSQDGWSGHLRVGITQCNPSELSSIPEMVIPDMTNQSINSEAKDQDRIAGKTWAVAITKFHNRVREKHKEVIGNMNEQLQTERVAAFANQRILIEDLYFWGQKELTFSSSGTRFPDVGQSTFAGSRIGIVLVPCMDEFNNEVYEPGSSATCTTKVYQNCERCNMHVIINGEDQGPCITGVPLDNPIFALVDVYSITKRVNIVAVSHLATLKDLCRDAVRKRVTNNMACNDLPLPKSLREFCRYR